MADSEGDSESEHQSDERLNAINLMLMELNIELPEYLKLLLYHTGFDTLSSLKLMTELDFPLLERFAKEDLLNVAPEDKYRVLGNTDKDFFKVKEGHKRILKSFIDGCKNINAVSSKRKPENQPHNITKKPFVKKQSKCLETTGKDDVTDDVTEDLTSDIRHISEIVRKYVSSFCSGHSEGNNFISQNETENEDLYQKNPEGTNIADKKNMADFNIEVNVKCAELAEVKCPKCGKLIRVTSKKQQNGKKWITSNFNKHFKTHFQNNLNKNESRIKEPTKQATKKQVLLTSYLNNQKERAREQGNERTRTDQIKEAEGTLILTDDEERIQENDRTQSRINEQEREKEVKRSQGISAFNKHSNFSVNNRNQSINSQIKRNTKEIIQTKSKSDEYENKKTQNTRSQNNDQNQEEEYQESERFRTIFCEQENQENKAIYKPSTSGINDRKHNQIKRNTKERIQTISKSHENENKKTHTQSQNNNQEEEYQESERIGTLFCEQENQEIKETQITSQIINKKYQPQEVERNDSFVENFAGFDKDFFVNQKAVTFSPTSIDNDRQRDQEYHKILNEKNQHQEVARRNESFIEDFEGFDKQFFVKSGLNQKAVKLTFSKPSTSSKKNWKDRKYSRLDRKHRGRDILVKNQTKITDYVKIIDKISETLDNKKIKQDFENELLKKGYLKPKNIKGFLQDLMDSAEINGQINKHSHNFTEPLKLFSLYLFLIGGRRMYETLYKNVSDGLPSITTILRILDEKFSLKEDQLRMKELKEYLVKKKLPLNIFVSEDQTAITKKIEYDPKTNKMIGFVAPPNNYSFPDTDKFVFNKISDVENAFANDVQANNGYIFMAQPLQENAAPFCLAIFGSNNKFTYEDVLKRWQYIENEAKKYEISISGFSSDGDSRCLKAMRIKMNLGRYNDNENFSGTVDIPFNEYLVMDYCPHKPLIVQDTIHISTKMKTRLLKENICLPMGRLFVSPSHIREVMKNFGKDQHLLNEGVLNISKLGSGVDHVISSFD